MHRQVVLTFNGKVVPCPKHPSSDYIDLPVQKGRSPLALSIRTVSAKNLAQLANEALPTDATCCIQTVGTSHAVLLALDLHGVQNLTTNYGAIYHGRHACLLATLQSARMARRRSTRFAQSTRIALSFLFKSC